MKTAEFVSPMHPDKICDYIADCILDAYLEEDKESRCAIEVMGGHGLITINGEVTSKANPDIEKVVKSLVGDNFKIIINIVLQSPQIAQGVDSGGAGDQGIMMGYACDENEEMVPLEYYFARNICNHIYKKYPYDGKVQVTLSWDNGGAYQDATILASFQNVDSKTLEETIREWVDANSTKFFRILQYRVYVNTAGDWTQGGFDADTGLSGRKLIIDNYGPEITIGGGSFSGKDYTKVDRSGAYMARKIAVDLLKKHNAKEVYIKLAYAIGKSEPIMAVVVIDGVESEITGYDLTPRGIYKNLRLDEVEFKKTSNWGHFGRGFTWN
jgi:S-adenosylmethionine synthetase